LHFELKSRNNYDLQIQHNEALELALEKIGVERLPNDRFFDGIAGNRLVKVIPLQRACTIVDLSAIERELLEMRADETRDILVVCLGAENTVAPWIAEKNLLNSKSKLNQYRLVNLREGGFFEHLPSEALISVTENTGEIEISLDNFHSPTIVERLGIENKKSVIQAKIPDFRSQIDCVLIDTDYNGEVFQICHSDIPPKKNDLIQCKYSFPPKECGKKIAVKIIDMLGEEVVQVLER